MQTALESEVAGRDAGEVPDGADVGVLGHDVCGHEVPDAVVDRASAAVRRRAAGGSLGRLASGRALGGLSGARRLFQRCSAQLAARVRRPACVAAALLLEHLPALARTPESYCSDTSRRLLGYL